MAGCSMTREGRLAGSPTEVCAQMAEWQWCAKAQLIVHLECTEPGATLGMLFRALPHLRFLTCCWVTDGHRNLLPLPTRSMDLWRRYMFCRKKITMSYPGFPSKHHGLSWSERQKYVLFTLPVSFAAAQGKLYHTGRERNVQRAAGFVQLHAHNPLVLYPIVTAPDFIRQGHTVNSLL